MKIGIFGLLSVFAILTIYTQASIDAGISVIHENVSTPSSLTWYRWKYGAK
jgi:hypothetical protein